MLPSSRRGRVVLALVIPPAFAVAAFIALSGTGRIDTFRNVAGSMEPTLRCGDRFVVERLTSRSRNPERGDIVVFHPPASPEGPEIVATGDDAGGRSGDTTVEPAKATFVKRVIGLPGERVEVRDHRAIVDGEQLDEPYAFHDDAFDPGAVDWGPKEVPKGTYLLLGDHRDNAADGRVFGFVPKQFVEGRVAWLYWPPGRIGRVTDDTMPGSLAERPDPACLGAASPAS